MNNLKIEVNKYDVKLMQQTMVSALDTIRDLMKQSIEAKEPVTFSEWLMLESLIAFPVENCELMKIEAVSDEEWNERFSK